MSTHGELVDDLASVLGRMVVGWEHVIGVNLAEHPEVVRVMKRYRAYKLLTSGTAREEEE